MVGMDSFVLLAVPLFTLAGYLMEQGGLSRRLVDIVEKIFGRFLGASGTVTIVCCAIFAALTGSGPATVAAIGAVMLPALDKSGYPKRTAAGMLAAGGALGPIIPPSITMIVYGSTMSLSIPAMFLGGVIPGILIAILFIVVNIILAKRYGIKPNEEKYKLKDIAISLYKSIAILMLPVIVLGGIYGGIFTPTEAATICVIYSIILGFAYRELTVKKLLEAMKKTVVTSSTVAVLLGVASVFGWILASAKIPNMLAEALIPILGNKYTYTFVLMMILFVVGCLMDSLTSIIILAPILVPIGLQLGMDPLHLGVLFCINLVIGFITPPFGLNLFTAVSVTGTGFVDVVRGVLPFLIAAILAVFVLAYVPGIILFLPNLNL